MALEKKKPTLLQALTPLIALALLLSIGYGVYGLRAEILLLVATSVAGLIAIMLGYSYREIERGIIENMMKGMPAMLIVIVVGALIGSWMSAGTIPMMIFYGLKLISPEFFLVSACIVCSIISLVTGTSYGTVVVPLIPWSIAGVFMAGTLGVDTIAYAPWAIMCYTSFLVTIFYAYTGIAIAPKRNEDETQPGS
jgi:Na+/H+ antiporter NhaC